MSLDQHSGGNIEITIPISQIKIDIYYIRLYLEHFLNLYL